MQQSAQNKKHGGHQTGFREDISKGTGPVIEVRAALGLSQADFAKRLGAGFQSVVRWEREGRWPGSVAVKRELRRLANEAGVDLSEWEP